MNLDPGAEDLPYEPAIDIRDLVSVDDVKEELGPNGALVYCFEHLANNLDWLKEQLGDYNEDYLIVDMPGQVELFTHYRHLNRIIRCLEDLGYIVCSVYLIDSRFLMDTSTFISATLMAMACQMNLELPHFNALTKMDIVKRDNLVSRQDIDRYLDPDADFLMSKLVRDTSPKFKELNGVLSELITDFSLVRFHPISANDPDAMDDFLAVIDMTIQFGEDAEPKMEEEAIPDDYEEQ
jgi:hypothetical protein